MGTKTEQRKKDARLRRQKIKKGMANDAKNRGIDTSNTPRYARPRVYNSVEELSDVISEYFNECRTYDIPVTFEGLAYYMGVSRATLLNYESNPEYSSFFSTVRGAKEYVLKDLTERGLSGKNHATLTMFLLKNNYHYDSAIERKITNNTIITGLSDAQIREAMSDD